MAAAPRERLRANATEIAGTAVTGLWLAALLSGYVVVVPLVALLFGDEDDVDEWWEDRAREGDRGTRERAWLPSGWNSAPQHRRSGGVTG